MSSPFSPRPVNRVLLSALLVVATLAGTLLATWFTLHSKAFAGAVVKQLDEDGRPGVFSFDHIEFGPGIYDATVYGVTMLDRAGAPLLTADRIFVSLEALPDIVKDVRSRVVVKRIEADGFMLRLEWNLHGYLELVDPFRNRSMDIDRSPPKKVDVLFDLQDIRLTNGRLFLGWPKFGFLFDDINGGGSVKIDNDGLHINVPTLGSALGGIWLAGGGSRLTDAAQGLKTNAIAELTKQPGVLPLGPPKTVLPFDAVTFTNFVWEGTGFETGLRIAGTGGWSVDVLGGLVFPKKGPNEQNLKIAVNAPSSFTETLTGGKVVGLESASITLKGKDMETRYEVAPLALDKLVVGERTIDGLRTDAWVIDLSGGAFEFSGGLALERLVRVQEQDGKPFRTEVGASSGKARGRIGWDGFTAKAFLAPIQNPPTSTLGWVQAYPLNAQVDLGVDALDVASVQKGDTRLDKLALRGVSLKGGLSAMKLGAQSVSASGHGSGSVDGVAKVGLGFSGVSLNVDATAKVDGVPRSSFGVLLPTGVDLSSVPDLMTGTWRIQGDPRKGAEMVVTASGASPDIAPP
ncbi:MAG: hypothetical protein IV100_01190 [Myxococcales bacterium]|nr:hypothetical protein [Myxococcales bacterium]